MFASRAGIGYELVQAIMLHDMPRMYGIVAMLVVIAFVVNALLLALGARLLAGPLAARSPSTTGSSLAWSASGTTGPSALAPHGTR